jgi:hypothetical protein
MSGALDWVFWLLGGVLGAGGLVLAVWALFADRARGRRRCPRCWYDLSATDTLICSECGYTAPHDKKLRKTRRRWRWACVAVAFVVAGVGGALTPKVKRDGWPSVLPTTALVFAMPDLPQRSQQAYDVLEGRIKAGTLWEWQWRMLIRQCWDEAAPFWSLDLPARDRWPRDVPVAFAASFQVGETGWTWFDWARVTLRLETDLAGVHPVRVLDTRSPRRRFFSRRLPTRSVAEGFEVAAPGSDRRSFCLFATVQLHAGGRQPVRLKRFKIPAQVVGSTADILDPVVAPDLDGWLREHMEIRRCIARVSDPPSVRRGDRRWREGISVNFSVPGRISAETDDLTLALRFELLRDGEPVATARGWVDAHEVAGGRRLFMGWEEAASPLDFDTHEWLVRVSGDDELALRHVDCPRYWSGQFVIPLSGDLTRPDKTSVGAFDASWARR